MRPPFGQLPSALPVGAGYFERQGLARADVYPQPRGVVDDISELAHPGIDTARIHPQIRVFFEDTAGLELLIRSRWRFPFSALWWLMRPLLKWAGQFVLPQREARILTRVFAIDQAQAGLANARAVVRTYADPQWRDTGQVFQAVAYTTWQHADTGYMHATFPLPCGHIVGVLRLDQGVEGADGWLSVALSSRPAVATPDAARVWFVVGGRAVASGFGERFSMWAPEAPGAPQEVGLEGATIVALHEQFFLGIRLVSHHYWFRPRPEAG